MTKHTSVELEDNDEAYTGYEVAHVLGWIVLGLLLGIVLAPNVLSQEVGLEDVPQKELEGLPVKDGGVLAQTWDWFISLLGYEVEDVDVIKRSIVEQDLDIEDVRLITKNITTQRHNTKESFITNAPTPCGWNDTTQTNNMCETMSKVTIEWNDTITTGTYQVIVTPTQTYDTPDKTSCYEQQDKIVCESTLRCDGRPGIEYGCEHFIIQKQPRQDGTISLQSLNMPPVRSMITRKQVIQSDELIYDESLTKYMPENIVDSIREQVVQEEETMMVTE